MGVLIASSCSKKNQEMAEKKRKEKEKGKVRHLWVRNSLNYTKTWIMVCTCMCMQSSDSITSVLRVQRPAWTAVSHLSGHKFHQFLNTEQTWCCSEHDGLPLCQMWGSKSLIFYWAMHLWKVIILGRYLYALGIHIRFYLKKCLAIIFKWYPVAFKCTIFMAKVSYIHELHTYLMALQVYRALLIVWWENWRSLAPSSVWLSR